jgi:hypothetical protein
MDPNTIIAGVTLTLALLATWIRGEVRSRTNADAIKVHTDDIKDLYDKWELHTSNRSIHPEAKQIEEMDKELKELGRETREGFQELGRSQALGFQGVNQRIDRILEK